MGVWELEAGIGLMLFGLVMPLLVFPLVRWGYTMFGRLPAVPTVAALATVLYGFGLVAFTLFPIPADSAEACSRGDLSWRFDPRQSFGDAASVAADVGGAAFLTSTSFLQIVLNVVFFVPLGLLLGWRTRRSLSTAALVGLGVSLTIELTQGTGVWGLYDCAYRLADTQDLLTNTAGTTLGWLLGRHLLARIPWPERVPVAGFTDPSDDVPTVGRRAVAVFTDLVAIVLIGIVLQIVLGVVARGADRSADLADWPALVAVVVGTALPVILVGVVMPMLRSDRAGPGAWSTRLGVRPTHGDTPPGLTAMAIRAGVRWAPIVVLSLGGTWALVCFSAATAGQLAVVWRAPDHASLAGQLSGTESHIVRTR